MNELARVAGSSVTLPAAFREAPGALGAAIRAHSRGASFRPVTQSLRDAATRHLAATNHALQPAGQTLMLAWLQRLAPAVINAPVEAAEIMRKAEAIWDVCQDLPSGVWTDEARRDWCKRQPEGKFWPQAGELHAHLAPLASQIRADAAGCRAIIDDGLLPAETPPKPGTDERAAILAKFRADMQQVRAEQGSEDREPIVATPRHLRTDAMIAAYQALAAQGGLQGGLARTRLRMLGVDVP